MKRFSKIEAVVTDILETMPATRSDDYLLMLFVTEKMKPSLLGKTLDEVLSNHYKNGLPNWERLAIYDVMNMPTHNGVTKEAAFKALSWLWHKAFELEQEGDENE